MARYTRRRIRTRRAYRKKRGGNRRTRRSTRVKRYPSARQRINQSKVFTFTRQTEATLFNTDPVESAPYVATTDATYLQIGADDPTSLLLPGHKNFGFSIVDSLSKLQNYAEFTSLFQYYRVIKITRRIVPVYGAGSSNQFGYTNENVGDDANFQGGYAIPTLMVLPDKDSAEPITAAAARETAGVRRVRMGKTYTETYAPVPAMPVGQTTTGGSLFAVVPRKCPWMSCQDAATVQLYGRRYGILDWPGPSNNVGDLEGDEVPCAWRIYSTYTVQFKGLQ